MSKGKIKVRTCIDCGCEIRSTCFQKPIGETLCRSCAHSGPRSSVWKGGIAGKPKVRKCVDCGCECQSTEFRKPIEETRCLSCSMKGERGNNWKGGKRRCSQGYVYIYKPVHPRSDAKGRIKRCYLVWEAANGRYIQPGEVVHHIDGVKDNDIIDNLQVMTHGDHSSLHMSGKNNPSYKHGKRIGWRKKYKKG